DERRAARRGTGTPFFAAGPRPARVHRRRPDGCVNYARVYIRIPPHHERRFTFGRLFSFTPWKAFVGNYSQREVVQQVRQRLKRFGDIRASVRSGASSISLGGPNFEIDFSILGPDLESLAQYAEQLRQKAPDI